MASSALLLLDAVLAFASSEPRTGSDPMGAQPPPPLPPSPPSPPAQPAPSPPSSPPSDYITAKAAFCASLQQRLDEHLASGNATFQQKKIVDFLAIDASKFDGKLLPWFDLNVLYPLTIATVLQGASMSDSQQSAVAGETCLPLAALVLAPEVETRVHRRHQGWLRRPHVSWAHELGAPHGRARLVPERHRVGERRASPPDDCRPVRPRDRALLREAASRV